MILGLSWKILLVLILIILTWLLITKMTHIYSGKSYDSWICYCEHNEGRFPLNIVHNFIQPKLDRTLWSSGKAPSGVREVMGSFPSSVILKAQIRYLVLMNDLSILWSQPHLENSHSSKIINCDINNICIYYIVSICFLLSLSKYMFTCVIDTELLCVSPHYISVK